MWLISVLNTDVPAEIELKRPTQSVSGLGTAASASVRASRGAKSDAEKLIHHSSFTLGQQPRKEWKNGLRNTGQPRN